MDLLIDQELKNITPSLSTEEYQLLEQSIISEGCRDAIAVWKGHNIILDGHNRYAICKQHNKPYSTLEISLNSHSDVEEWIIKAQFGRRNLNAYQRSVLALKLKDIYAAQAKKRQLSSLKQYQNTVTQISAQRSETRQKLAKVAGVSHDTINKVEKIEALATPEQKEKVATGEVSINETYRIVKKKDKSQQNYNEGNMEWLRVYNVWNFQRDVMLGQEHPGNIPGQIALNILHYYTSEGDLVIDPMAGGGSTIDACKRLNRKCFAYDIDIKRDDIIYNNIRQGFPLETKDCQLIFLDPPYYQIMRDKYIEASVSSLDLQGFLDFLDELAANCYKTVKQGGFVTFLCQNYYSKFASLDGYINFGIEGYKRFTNAGFVLVNEINCPQSSQVYSASDVELAKKQKGMLNLVRDLLVFRKNN